MPVTSKKELIKSAAKKAVDSLRKRAKADITVIEMTRSYKASLESAAKKCHESLKHVEAVAFGHEKMPPMLSEARKAIILAINMIVVAATSDQRKKSYVTKKDAANRENLISYRKKLEDDNFFDYKRTDNDFDVSCQSSTG